jgi:acyl-CoA synthetase (AMP-forming)/AMP-acid ligase II
MRRAFAMKNQSIQQFGATMMSYVLLSEHAKFKLPKRVFLAKELPRNSMGKVQKVELAKQYADLFKG